MTPEELTTIKAGAETALEAVHRGWPWPEIDNDLVIGAALKDVPVLVAEMERLAMPAPPDSSEVTHEATHPGFTVICHQCRSRSVYVENTLGYSDASGMWGNVTLICANCGHKTDLVAVG